MSIESSIAELVEMAGPLRLLEDIDPLKDRLPAIVDEINRLRALQSLGDVLDAEAHIPLAQVVEPVKRGPGRPAKAKS